MFTANVMEQPPARASEKARDEFVDVLRILAHKLSQPLTCLRGSVEVALMGEMRESESREVLEQSLEESRRMAETLEMLRDALEMEGSEEDIQPVSWRRSIEKLLEEATFVDGNCPPQLVSDVMGEVWVKASPQHLDTATRRLIGRVIKEARGKQPVQVRLSVFGEAACLSICEEGLFLDAEPTEKGNWTRSLAETLEPGDLDGWMIRRSIELQGGWFKIIRMPGAGCCYQLSLPMAFSGVGQHA